LLITHSMLIPSASMHDMADMTPAKNFDLSCMNCESMRYVADVRKLSWVDRCEARRGSRGMCVYSSIWPGQSMMR
jgi:hypothetical protein